MAVGTWDSIADWYAGFVAGPAAPFTERGAEALRRALGPGDGLLWDVACGNGVYAAVQRGLGWTVVGSDLSAGQLAHAAGRLPVVRADARAAPLRPASVDAVCSVFCSTDVDDYAALCRSAAAALKPGGRFAHVGLHPCFAGAFVTRETPDRWVTTPGYWDRGRTFTGPPDGVRVRVGAVHLPLSDLTAAILAAGLRIDAVHELGTPTPDVLAITATHSTR